MVSQVSLAPRRKAYSKIVASARLTYSSQLLATAKELCRELYISEPTVRRALSALSELGLIIRTHGGAIYKGEPGANLPLSFREREHSEAKAKIAKKCLSLIKDGDTVMLDGSGDKPP